MRRFTIAVTVLSLFAAVLANAYAGGKGLSEEMRLYWTWALGGKQPDHHGNVQFIPLPTNGVGVEQDGHTVWVGTADVTLKKNQSFFLPMSVWYAEAYADGSEDAPDFPAASAFTEADVLIEIDGVPFIDSHVDDLRDYFVDKVYFKKPIRYDQPTSYGSVAALWVKGIGFEHAPLSVGTHVLHLRVLSDFFDASGGSSRFDNTWTITVRK